MFGFAQTPHNLCHQNYIWSVHLGNLPQLDGVRKVMQQPQLGKNLVALQNTPRVNLGSLLRGFPLVSIFQVERANCCLKGFSVNEKKD
jgi:hypothetical protein